LLVSTLLTPLWVSDDGGRATLLADRRSPLSFAARSGFARLMSPISVAAWPAWGKGPMCGRIGKRKTIPKP